MDDREWNDGCGIEGDTDICHRCEKKVANAEFPYNEYCKECAEKFKLEKTR